MKKGRGLFGMMGTQERGPGGDEGSTFVSRSGHESVLHNVIRGSCAFPVAGETGGWLQPCARSRRPVLKERATTGGDQ